MNLIVLILLYLGVITSADQATDQVINDNQQQIESVMQDGIVINTLTAD